MRLLREANAQLPPTQARELEANAHALAVDAHHYNDIVFKVAQHLHSTGSIDDALISHRSPQALMKGTLTERIQRTEDERRRVFEKMLQEKYESISSSGGASSLRCRRCSSTDILVEQKQTRSADEGMSVYCVCSTCDNRWTMR